MMWSQVFDKKIIRGYCENVKFRSGSEWAFEFLRYLMVLRFLNDHNMILFINVKVVIIERIRDESWFQLSILNYGCYTFIKCIMSSIIIWRSI